jgi:hypothetical protein
MKQRGLALVVVLDLERHSHASSYTTWEYKTIYITVEGEGVGPGDPMRTLNQLGSEGWELVQMNKRSQNSTLEGYWIFKRPK